MVSKNYKQLVAKVFESVGAGPFQKELVELDRFLPLLERMRLEGAVVVLKFDGERGPGDNGPYTALVSGKVLKGDFFRTDADTLEEALAYIIVNYARKQWGFTE